MADFHDHFSDVAPGYAEYRPVYPAELIADLAAMAPTHDLAWDCATGSGQAARLLAAHFTRVLATDASAAQIARAQPQPGVDFRVGREDQSGAADASVGLVTVATALHWLDLERFHAEVRRVLQPGGVVAAWCYGLARISPEVDAITSWFANDRMGPYWPPQRVHVDNGYRALSFPFSEVSLGPRVMTAMLTREQYLGYVATWSSVAAARRAGVDPVPELRARLASVWPDEERLLLTWPLHVRVGVAHRTDEFLPARYGY